MEKAWWKRFGRGALFALGLSGSAFILPSPYGAWMLALALGGMMFSFFFVVLVWGHSNKGKQVPPGSLLGFLVGMAAVSVLIGSLL